MLFREWIALVAEEMIVFRPISGLPPAKRENKFFKRILRNFGYLPNHLMIWLNSAAFIGC